jgi:hypothetical protein
MENFKQWVEGNVNQHALDGLRRRLARWPDILERVEQRVQVAKDIYNDNKSWALQIDELPEYAQTGGLDGSNGDIVVIVVRPDRDGTPTVITGFLRRSPEMEGRAQPFTPDALRVDRVASLPEFNRHVLRFLRQNLSMKDVA